MGSWIKRRIDAIAEVKKMIRNMSEEDIINQLGILGISRRTAVHYIRCAKAI